MTDKITPDMLINRLANQINIIVDDLEKRDAPSTVQADAIQAYDLLRKLDYWYAENVSNT